MTFSLTATTFPFSAKAPSAMSVPAPSAPATLVPPNLHLQSGPSQVAHRWAAALRPRYKSAAEHFSGGVWNEQDEKCAL